MTSLNHAATNTGANAAPSLAGRLRRDNAVTIHENIDSRLMQQTLGYVAGLPREAARIIAGYFDTLQKRISELEDQVEALRDAGRNKQPAHLRKVETRSA